MNQNGMNRSFSQSWYVFTGFCDRHFSRILFTCGFNLFVIEKKMDGTNFFVFTVSSTLQKNEGSTKGQVIE